MLNNIRNLRFTTKSAAGIFLLISFLAYGLLIPFTGFYWDDWPFAWSAHFLGAREFFPSFAPFRPFLAPFFYITSGLLPENPMLWQAFAVFVRALTAFSLWFAIDAVWPEHKRQTITVCLLFLIFPGYSQGWVALTHINQELLPLILLHLSFGFSARALRQPENFKRFTAMGILLQIAGLFPTEYFFTLEVIRFFLIWVIIAESTQGFGKQFVESIKKWIPYLLIWFANAAWLYYYYNYGAYNSYQVQATNISATASLSNLAASLFDALFKAGFYSWVQVLKHLVDLFPSPTFLFTGSLIVITFLGAVFYFSRLDSNTSTRSVLKSFLLIGVLAILLGRLPSWAAGLPLTLQSSYDRFMISMMFGAALFIAGLLELINNRRARVVVTSLLIAFSIGQQFINANIFRRDWEAQREFYWQLAWRIPALEPNTIIFTNEMPVDYETDLSFTAPINWMYAPGFKKGDALPYAMLYTEKRLGGGILHNLEPNTPIRILYRTVTFSGTPAQSITIYMPRNGCLRVLDSVYANENIYKNQPASLTSTIPLSDPSRIIASESMPALPRAIFGAEPEHTWCYYYTKAELARQQADWEKIIVLFSEADNLGYTAQDPVEYLPFIEAFAQLGQTEQAIQLSETVLSTNPRMHVGLCQLWQRVPDSNKAEDLLNRLNCPR